MYIYTNNDYYDDIYIVNEYNDKPDAILNRAEGKLKSIAVVVQ